MHPLCTRARIAARNNLQETHKVSQIISNLQTWIPRTRSLVSFRLRLLDNWFLKLWATWYLSTLRRFGHISVGPAVGEDGVPENYTTCSSTSPRGDGLNGVFFSDIGQWDTICFFLFFQQGVLYNMRAWDTRKDCHCNGYSWTLCFCWTTGCCRISLRQTIPILYFSICVILIVKILDVTVYTILREKNIYVTTSYRIVYRIFHIMISSRWCPSSLANLVYKSNI